MSEQALADIVSLHRARNLRSSKTLVDPVVAWWKCRVGICRTMCGVTETAIFAFGVFNEELRRHRLTALDADEVMLCPEHAYKVDRDKQWR